MTKARKRTKVALPNYGVDQPTMFDLAQILLGFVYRLIASFGPLSMTMARPCPTSGSIENH